MKWLRTLLQRGKKEAVTQDDTSSVPSPNNLEYEFRDPFYREPPWSISIPLPIETVLEVFEQDFVPTLVPAYQVTVSIPKEDDRAVATENWTITRYTVRLKPEDKFGIKRSPTEALVCIISLHFLETDISAIDCEVPNLQNRRYYDSIAAYLRVIIKQLYGHTKKDIPKVVTHKVQADPMLTTEQEQVDRQAKDIGQERELRDPSLTGKPWSMTFPLDTTAWPFSGDSPEEPKEVLIWDMDRELKERCNYLWRVSVMELDDDDGAFVRYNFRQKYDDSIICSLTLTLLSSDTFTVTCDVPDEEKAVRSYEIIEPCLRDFALYLYRFYGKREPKPQIDNAEDTSITAGEEAQQVHTQHESDTPSSEAERVRSGYGTRPETEQKMLKLRELRTNSIRGGKVTLQWTIACEQVGISPNTAKRLDPKLRARWDDATYA